MAVELSEADIRATCRISEILLAPVEYEEVDDWRLTVNAEVRDLLRADSAGFLLPLPGLAPVLSAEHDQQSLVPFTHRLPPPFADGTPIWTRMADLGVATLRMAYGAQLGTYHGSDYYNEYAAPRGMRQTIAATVGIGEAGPGGSASLHLWSARLPAKCAFGQREVALLRLIFPAFQSAVSSLMALGSSRRSLLSALDDVGAPLIIYDRDGKALHEAPAASRALGGDGEENTLRRAMGCAARAVLGSREEIPTSLVREVRTGRARYRVLASSYKDDSARVVVALRRLTPEPCSARELNEEYGLTPAEVRVALQIAEGKANAEIAGRLVLSPSTVRRHTERILKKLGATSRAGIAARLYR